MLIIQGDISLKQLIWMTFLRFLQQFYKPCHLLNIYRSQNCKSPDNSENLGKKDAQFRTKNISQISLSNLISQIFFQNITKMSQKHKRGLQLGKPSQIWNFPNPLSPPLPPPEISGTYIFQHIQISKYTPPPDFSGSNGFLYFQIFWDPPPDFSGLMV